MGFFDELEKVAGTMAGGANPANPADPADTAQQQAPPAGVPCRAATWRSCRRR